MSKDTRQINVAPQRLWRTAHGTPIDLARFWLQTVTVVRVLKDTLGNSTCREGDAAGFFFALFRLDFIMLRFIDSYHTGSGPDVVPQFLCGHTDSSLGITVPWIITF